MWHRIERLVLVAIALGVVLWGTGLLVESGGRSPVAWAVLAGLPLIGIYMFCPLWWMPALVASSLVIGLPVAVLSSLPVATLVLVPTVLALVLRGAIGLSGGRRPAANPLVTVSKVLTVLLLLRIAMDRPGLASMGGRGGLSLVFPYALALVSFGVTYWAVRTAGSSRRGDLILLAAGIFAHVLYIACGIRYSSFDVIPSTYYIGPVYRGHLFQAPAWLAYASLLASLLPRGPLRTPRWTVITGVVVLALAVALVSVHRALPLYALLIPSIILWCFGYGRRMLVIFVLAALIVGGLSAHYDALPVYVQRPLSVFVPYKAEEQSAYGWKDSFRSDRLREAWAAIRQAPILGRGFVVTAQDVFRETSTAGHFALYHSYHNIYLNLSGAYGVPLGLGILVWASILLVHVLLQAARLPPGPIKATSTALAACGAALYIQSHVNGSGTIMVGLMVCLAACAATADSHVDEAQPGDLAVPASPEVVSPVEPAGNVRT